MARIWQVSSSGVCSLRHTYTTLGFVLWRVIGYNSQSHLQSEVTSACYIAQISTSEILSFLWQEGYVLFSATTQMYITIMRCNVLFVMYNFSGQRELQISRQLNELLQKLQEMLGTICRMIPFLTFMAVCKREYTPSLTPDGDRWDFLGNPYCKKSVSFGRNLPYTYRDKKLYHHSWRKWRFWGYVFPSPSYQQGVEL